ncbi:hypothetical protein PV682_21335 [Streptomyces niveiscabiei]|uniref:hypothetical protein n=1 Tax=Streptomyces niveiscabiei TaxID=164115 RepID=UPI0029A4EE06|nr:hypothetical protein [Streptomyces niveiscabiei]MDX3383985.1 hypothetical protein [Streptomyces niveiscabiei]
MIRGEANFLPGVYVPCARARYNRATLEVSCRGRSSADVLSLGRSATTLSGGEAQRVGLARRVRGCSLFVLDGTPEQVAPHPGRFPHSPSEA